MQKGAFDLKGYKKKKICLIDVDSSIPNLALMKISSFFKKNKWEVDLIKLNYSAYDHHKRKIFPFDAEKYDKVFISILFLINKIYIKIKNCKNVYRGGTGYNIKINLPTEIEHMFPDYSLYPDNEYSIGYLSRGCIRQCEFCFVHKKEGALKLHSPLREFYNKKLPKIMLLDNNFLALPNCTELMEELKKTGKSITFKQGLDFRLLTPEKAKLLASLNYDGEFIFAFDNPDHLQIIQRNLKIWKPLVKDWRTKFYVLVGFNTSLEKDLMRINFLKQNKCLPYIMRHTNCYTSANRALYTDLAAWCNQPGIFKNMSFLEFFRRRHEHSSEERRLATMNIIEKENLVIN